MSHIVSVHTRVKNPIYVKKALTRMGIMFTETETSLNHYGGNARVQIKFDDACGLQRQADNTWAFVGDPYYSTSQKLKSYYHDNTKFSADLGTAYAVEETKQELANQGWRCIENEEAEVGRDQLITMVFEGNL